MEFDVLVKLINDKIASLDGKLALEKQSMAEIAQFQDAIREIKDDPYCLYTSEKSDMIKFLGFSAEQLEDLAKYKKIYEGYVLFGREAIPQISIVEEATLEIQADLERKVGLLSDVIARHQFTILDCESYNALLGEVNDNSSYITRIDVLLKLLNESDLDVSKRNEVKKAVIARNNYLYQEAKALVEKAKEAKTKKDVVSDTVVKGLEVEEATVEDNKLEVQPVEVVVGASSVEEEGAVSIEQDIEREVLALEEVFGKNTLSRMRTLVDIIANCEADEDLKQMLEGWEHSLGVPYLEMIDGLVSLMKIEMLEAKYIYGEDEVKDSNSEMEEYRRRFNLLQEYRNGLVEEQRLENEAFTIDTTNMSELDKVLVEYDSDPLSTPNQVIFLNNAVGRDIASIKDKETLQDVFLLIEKFRKGEIQSVGMNEFEKIMEVKPNNSKKRRARVMIRHISDNVYGILGVIEKKSMRTKSEMVTLRGRERDSNTIIKRYQNNPDYASELVANTSEQMDKLISRISNKTVATKGGLS